MRITRQKAVYQLSFLPRFFPVNCYFVKEEDGLTLIDAALPYSAKSILLAAEQLKKPITRILLTHAHDDHVGSLDKLKERLPDVPVYISKRDARLLAGDKSLDEHESQMPIKGGVSSKLKTRPDVLIQEGDQIGSLLAVATPGHTPGSMSFFDTRTSAFIVGDAFQIQGGVAVAGKMQPFFPFPAMATWNKQAAIESAQKIRSYNPSVLAVGHGDMLQNPCSAIDVAIKEAEQYEKQAKRKE